LGQMKRKDTWDLRSPQWKENKKVQHQRSDRGNRGRKKWALMPKHPRGGTKKKSARLEKKNNVGKRGSKEELGKTKGGSVFSVFFIGPTWEAGTKVSQADQGVKKKKRKEGGGLCRL